MNRTFNYDAERARQIWSYILEHNRESRFHFEIGAHLLDNNSLELLAKVPEGMFQFEIGVQLTLPATLLAIDRRASLERLEENVIRLRRAGNIHLHLDLIAGLPGEGYRPFLASIDRVTALQPHHLQVEAVKLLPGSPLRRQAKERQIRFDPHPPYTVLATPDLSFTELQRLGGISRLLDLTWNSNRLPSFLAGLTGVCDSLARGLEKMEEYFRRNDLFRHPLSQRTFFQYIGEFVQTVFAGEDGERLRELLARDYARNERIVPDNAPDFFAAALTAAEAQRVRKRVKEETTAVHGKGIKVQHFAAVFSRLPEHPGRTVLLFVYLTRTGEGMQVREISL